MLRVFALKVFCMDTAGGGIPTRRLAARPHAAAAGVIFSGQNICRAQSQNCETKRHKTTLREKMEDLNDYLDLTEARVRDAGKPRLTHAEVKNRYGLK